MLIGVISDTHSRYQTARRVRELLEAKGVGSVLHCGDIEDDETVKIFAGLPAHFVLGNCDEDSPRLRSAIESTDSKLHDGFGHLELDGCAIAWAHGHERRVLDDVINSGHFDFVFYGHTHQPEQHRVGRTTVVNPGALHRAAVKTFVILDTASRTTESVVVD